MSNLRGPFRADHVGSFLRPQELKDARSAYVKGEIDKKALTEVEDKYIDDLVRKEKANGLKAITDGEFRRKWWHADFMWGIGGVEEVDLGWGESFNGTRIKLDSVALNGKLYYDGHPFTEHFDFLKKYEDEDHIAKLTIPSPAQFVTSFNLGKNDKHINDYYDDYSDFLNDVIKVYREFMLDVYHHGCRYLQFDTPSWGRLCTPAFRAEPAKQLRVANEKVLVDNGVLEVKPDDLVVTTHICRGNYRSQWNSEGGYDAVSKYLFQENIDGFFMEYDTERAGGFEPLADAREGQKVVLGLITSKFAQLEDKEEVKRRIEEASRYIPIENLYLSTQCGFASTEEGNILTEDEQWAKIRLVVDIAKEVWGNL